MLLLLLFFVCVFTSFTRYPDCEIHNFIDIELHINLCMCYPVCGMVHIKKTLLLIEKSSPCGGSGFPLSLSEWSFTICLTPYNRK